MLEDFFSFVGLVLMASSLVISFRCLGNGQVDEAIYFAILLLVFTVGTLD